MPLEITIDDLYGLQKEIAEVIGLDGFIALCKHFGGDEIYIQKYGELIKIQRDSEIRSKFNGYNSAELANEYDLTERHIRTICSDLIDTLRAAPLPGQLSLF